MPSDSFLCDSVPLLSLWSFELFWQCSISLFSALSYVMLAEKQHRYWLHSSLLLDECFRSLHAYDMLSTVYHFPLVIWHQSRNTSFAYLLLYYVLFWSVIVLFWVIFALKEWINILLMMSFIIHHWWCLHYSRRTPLLQFISLVIQANCPACFFLFLFFSFKLSYFFRRFSFIHNLNSCAHV